MLFVLGSVGAAVSPGWRPQCVFGGSWRFRLSPEASEDSGQNWACSRADLCGESRPH